MDTFLGFTCVDSSQTRKAARISPRVFRRKTAAAFCAGFRRVPEGSGFAGVAQEGAKRFDRFLGFHRVIDGGFPISGGVSGFRWVPMSVELILRVVWSGWVLGPCTVGRGSRGSGVAVGDTTCASCSPVWQTSNRNPRTSVGRETSRICRKSGRLKKKSLCPCCGAIGKSSH